MTLLQSKLLYKKLASFLYILTLFQKLLNPPDNDTALLPTINSKPPTVNSNRLTVNLPNLQKLPKIALRRIYYKEELTQRQDVLHQMNFLRNCITNDPTYQFMKMYLHLFRIVCFLLIVFASHSLFAQAKKPVAAPPAKDTAHYTRQIIDAANGTYGYDVYRAGKLVIHQPTVPAMPGNEGFKTKDDAEKVAGLVIQKIKKGEMPPTVSIAEMKTLKAL